MRTVFKILLIIIPILGIWGIFSTGFPEKEIEEYYQLGLSGIKKQYNIGEGIVFSIFLKGYGSECGTYDMQLKKGVTLIESKSIDIDCTEAVSKDFEFVNIDIATLEWILLETGDYTAIGEFTKSDGEKFQDEETFTVIEN